MEIQSTQNGQAFASTQVVVPVRTETSLAPETDSGDEEQATNREQSRRTAIETSRSNSISDNQKLSQASEQEADISEVEGSGVQLEEAVAKVESFLKVQNRDLAFTIDEDTNRSVVTVKDSQSGDVIRQIPSEEVLKLAERIQELQQDVGNSVGVFINNQV